VRLTPEEKTGMNNKTISVIILCLEDKVLREVARESGEALMLVRLTPEEKTEMNNKTISVIILCLGDKMLREVARETYDMSMWT
jgi:hypothetical protein